ncbi:MAG: exo-alpha-sialidase [Anaerolineae bacterium]|nr:exo-alpha-sialidase [Anaerolineae bacterium]
MGDLRKRVCDLLRALIDQGRTRVLVAPQRAASGYWFGGGSLAQDEEGQVWLTGRYRNYGDSRTGLQAGERGLMCALLVSVDGGRTYEQVRSWSKADLSRPGAEVLSIEGTALHRRADGVWELYVSSEKALPYPEDLRAFQKPGTGVWTIDRMTGSSPASLDPATLSPVLAGTAQPAYLHVKDPVLFARGNGATALIFSSHPFCWSSSNTGLALRERVDGPFVVQSWEVVSRGPAWDVAATRITDRMALPALGVLVGQGTRSVYFYDGAECLRAHDENPLAHVRPRGFSCEELGGAFLGSDAAFPAMERLSDLQPMFVSPWGTGCSRYVSTLVTEDRILAVWQQGQADGSQPLVGHQLPMERAAAILAGADAEGGGA